MNRKRFVIIALVVLIIVFVGVVAYVTWIKRSAQPTEISIPTPTSTLTPTLSNDQKSIIVNDTILLAIDDDEIFNLFASLPDYCDEGYNINLPGRRAFCENKKVFKSKTRFASIVLSPDKTKIGFTITVKVDGLTSGLVSDKVAGIFYPSRATDKVHFLTDYYLGNEFIGFSPRGIHFVYQGSCWEADCSLFIKNSETLADKIILPETSDIYRVAYIKFVRWISDNEVEYITFGKKKRASF